MKLHEPTEMEKLLAEAVDAAVAFLMPAALVLLAVLIVLGIVAFGLR